MHPYLQQNELFRFCQSEGIYLTAYSPLGRNLPIKNKPGLTNEPIIIDLAKKYNCTPAQIIIAWGYNEESWLSQNQFTRNESKKTLNHWTSTFRQRIWPKLPPSTHTPGWPTARLGFSPTDRTRWKIFGMKNEVLKRIEMYETFLLTLSTKDFKFWEDVRQD